MLWVNKAAIGEAAQASAGSFVYRAEDVDDCLGVGLHSLICGAIITVRDLDFFLYREHILASSGDDVEKRNRGGLFRKDPTFLQGFEQEPGLAVAFAHISVDRDFQSIRGSHGFVQHDPGMLGMARAIIDILSQPFAKSFAITTGQSLALLGGDSDFPVQPLEQELDCGEPEFVLGLVVIANIAMGQADPRRDIAQPRPFEPFLSKLFQRALQDVSPRAFGIVLLLSRSLAQLFHTARATIQVCRLAMIPREGG